MEIILIAFIFLVLLLLILWRPYFNQTKNRAINSLSTVQETSRKETNISLYQEHKAEIEKDFTQGAIDQESYQYLLAELDQSLLQDIEASEETLSKLAENEKDTSVNENAFGVLWPIGLTIFLLVFSFSLYQSEGAYTQLTQNKAHSNTSSDKQAQADAQRTQMIKYLDELRKQVENEPDNAEVWYTIGQTLVSVGMFDAGVNAYNQVIRIEGESADLYGVKAQAYYYKNNQQMDEQVEMLINKALLLNPNDAATNILVGMHNFINQQYQNAINAWQRVLGSNQVGVNTKALEEAVNEANKRLALTQPQVQPEQAQQAPNEVSTQSAAFGPQIKVHVSLSEDVAKKLSQGEDKVVFIYATPTDGRRMPLAALKLKASDLPVTVTLTDKDAMTPQNALSRVKAVHIYAIVSKLGGAGIRPGDYKAQISDIDVTTNETINLTVDHLVE